MFKTHWWLTAILSLSLIVSACSDKEPSTNQPDVNETPAGQEQTEEAPQSPTEAETDVDLSVDAKQVVATVNGDELTGQVYNPVMVQLKQVYQLQGLDLSDASLQADLQQQVLEIIVGNKLILLDAADKGYSADEGAVDEQYALVADSFESEQEMTDTLAKHYLTPELMRQEIEQENILQSYIAKELVGDPVTDEQIQAYYDAWAAQAGDSVLELAEVRDQIKTTLEQQAVQELLLQRVSDLKDAADVQLLL